MSRVSLTIMLLLLASCAKIPEYQEVPLQRASLPGQYPPTCGAYVHMSDPIVADYLVSDVSEGAPTDAWRWTNKKPTFRFKLTKVTGLRFEANYTIIKSILAATGAVTLTWSVNGHVLGSVVESKEGYRKFSKPVPAEWLIPNAENIVVGEVDKTWISPVDGAKLGFIISNLGFID